MMIISNARKNSIEYDECFEYNEIYYHMISSALTIFTFFPRSTPVFLQVFARIASGKEKQMLWLHHRCMASNQGISKAVWHS